MDDLMATRLCAEAMGYEVRRMLPERLPLTIKKVVAGLIIDPASYNPLHDDAQAMALVKKFKLDICHIGIGPAWRVIGVTTPIKDERAEDDNLNRAIVYCVAALQQAKGA